MNRSSALILTGVLVCLVGPSRAVDVPVADVPFEFLHNQIVLRATIAGRGPYNFILDTGTHASTIDVNVARRLNLDLGAAAAVIGAGRGRPTGRVTICPDLRIGALSVPRLQAVALDLSAMSRTLGCPLHGVLGFGFLDGRVAQIDYFHRRLRFLAESPPEPPDSPSTTSFPMRFRDNSVLPVLEDCLINRVRLPITIDTGSSLGLILLPKAVDRLGLVDLARAGIPMSATGYRGEARLSKGWITSVVLGTIDLGAIEVAYVERGYGDDEELERRAGNIGNAVLQDFVVTLDYRRRVVTLQSNAE